MHKDVAFPPFGSMVQAGVEENKTNRGRYCTMQRKACNPRAIRLAI